MRPADREDVLHLSWMRSVVESVCGVHSDVKDLIAALKLPVSIWDDKWINVYLDNSMKLLDICIAFSSKISRLKQGVLFLQCALHNLSTDAGNQKPRARSMLDGWKHHTGLKNPRLKKCFSIMDSLAQMLDLPEIKNCAKGKVLMRAMYGVKVVTLFISSILAAAFSGCSKALIEIKVPNSYLWGKAFTDLQTFINEEISNRYASGGVTVLKELEAVDTHVKKLYPVLQDGSDPIEPKVLGNYTSDLEGSVKKLSHGLDLLAKEVDRFFQVVLMGRDALLSKFRVGPSILGGVQAKSNGEVQTVGSR